MAFSSFDRADIRAETVYTLDSQFDNRTDLVAYEVALSVVHDARAFDYAYGDTGYWGATYCPSTSTQGGSDPARWCYPQYIRFNLTYSHKLDSAQERRAIACHELGHTVGLRHHHSQGVSCMYDPVLVDYLDGGHDIPQINFRY